MSSTKYAIETSSIKPFFPAAQLNPQHNIPFIVDGSLILNESRAITAYLIQKYGKDGGKQLLGSTPEEKAVINQRLNFDATVVWPRFLEALVSFNLTTQRLSS